MTTTEANHQLWAEGRTRFERLLTGLEPQQLTYQTVVGMNTAGFLIRHIAEVELLFAKNVFKVDGIKIQAHTVIDKRDTGVWTNLPELLDFAQQSRDAIKTAILNVEPNDWSRLVVTQEFGEKTLVQALGRIVSHTAYHGGQLALALKYPKI